MNVGLAGTNRRQDELDLEQALREQNQRLAVTYEHATVGIAEIDATGKRLRVNATACAITGRAREDLVGGNVFDVMHPEDREEDLLQLCGSSAVKSTAIRSRSASCARTGP